MYNALTKTLAMCFLTIGLTACSGNGSSEDGTNLLNQAKDATEKGEFLVAYKLIDSIDVVAPSDIKLRKQAIYQRTIIDEKSSIVDSIRNDSVLDKESLVVESLKNKFKFVKTKDMVEGYSVHKSAPELVNRTGIDVRINEQNELYVVSLLNGASVNHTQISVSNAENSVYSDNVPYNGSTNYRFKDGSISNEMVTFRGAKADSLCMFVSENVSSKLMLTFIGNKRHKQSLSKKEATIIAETYDYAIALQRLKKAKDLKMFYSNKIAIARKQQASTKTE